MIKHAQGEEIGLKGNWWRGALTVDEEALKRNEKALKDNEKALKGNE